jgi:hypothetical protein
MPDNSPGTFELIALELSRALEPLASRLHDHNVIVLLEELGFQLPHGVMSPALEGAIHDAMTAATALPSLTEDLITAIDDGEPIPIVEKALFVTRQVILLITAFDTIATELDAIGPIPGLTPADLEAFVAQLPKSLLGIMLIEYLEGYHPLPLAIMELLGLAEQTRENIGSTDPLRPEYVKRSLRFDRLGTLFQSPETLLTELYEWGQPTFKGELFIQRLAHLLQALDIIVTLSEIPGTPPRPALEIDIVTISPTAPPPPIGLEAVLMLQASDGVHLEIPFVEGWLVELAARGTLTGSTGIRLLPPADITVIPPSGSAQGRLTAGVAHVPVAPATSFPLLTLFGSSGLSAQRIGLALIAEFQLDSDGHFSGDLGFEGSIRGGKLKIGMDEADGFLATILSSIKLEADFDIAFGWTAGGGIYFTGSSVLEIKLPTHISLGPIELTGMTFGIGIQGNRFPVSFRTDIKAALGPLQAVVEQIGAAIAVSFPPNHDGNAGPVDLSFEFKPPKGVGLSIDVGVIKGGGYLFIDPERGEYAGALELVFSGYITLKAIGIITTRMPDGSQGFSLLIIISVEFGTGLQLGYGFTLLAVGGLLGLNRTMALQPLMEGVRSGAINSVMFPHDIIANAPRIISDLRTLFPPQQGKFLIGPMAKLGWATPTLISISLGVIIEIPGNIAIIGVLRVALPTADAPLINLQVNFAGAIEFDKKRLYFFASLFDSRIVFLTIEGEMGLLVAWGDDANFVVSVGGFHPQFSPPPLPFPSPRRIAVSLLNTDYARIRVEAYFAITSNTVQFGAHAELFFGLDAVNVQGHLGFDALFQFSPFHFVITISASFSLNVFGIGLFSVRIRGNLEGPSPWRAHGEGSISFLFFDVSADFDVTWGESRDTSLPPISVMPLFKAEFEKVENWRALPPPGNNLLVSLRKLPEDEGALVLHPVGVLRVSQRLLPLELTLDKVGNQKADDVKHLSVTAAPGGLERKGDAFEQFALAQFQNMSDSEKVSHRAFEPERAGIDLSAAGTDLRSSRMVKRVVRYEEIIIDSNFKRFTRRFFNYTGVLFNFFLGGNSIARSELSQATKNKYQPFAEKVAVSSETYTVAFQATNQPYTTTSATFHTEASAREFLNTEIGRDANLAETLHVIPSYERAA